MTRADTLRAELASIANVLEVASASPLDEWSPEWMALQGLRRRHIEVLHQLDLIGGTAELEVQLYGGAERNNEVDAGVLGDFLREIQQAISATVQGLISEETARGSIGQDILGQATLRVGAALPGSFVVRMTGPERVQQLGLSGDEPPPPFDQAVELLIDVLEASGDDTGPDALLSAVSAIPSNRALAHIRTLAATLARTDTSATVIERSPYADEPREAPISSGSAARLQEVLTRTHQVTEELEMTGQLSGVRWTKGIFDLEVPYGDETVVVSGRVSADMRPSVSAAFDRMVRAKLLRTVTQSEISDVARDSYLLIGIELLDQDPGTKPSQGR